MFAEAIKEKREKAAEKVTLILEEKGFEVGLSDLPEPYIFPVGYKASTPDGRKTVRIAILQRVGDDTGIGRKGWVIEET